MLSGFCAFFLAPMGISRTNLKKYGKWAGQCIFASTDMLIMCVVCYSLSGMPNMPVASQKFPKGVSTEVVPGYW